MPSSAEQPAAPPPASIPAPPAPVVAPDPPPPYRQLPGRVPFWWSAAYGQRKLYLGGDHLLQVETMYFMENCRRFAYADIQSFLLRQTPRGLIYSVILGVFAAGFALLGWGMDTRGPRWTCWGLAGVLVLLLLLNLARGRTCRCRLQTAVGPQPLPSLSRVRPARKTLRLLAERIDAAQGALDPTDAARRLDEWVEGGTRKSERGS